MKQPGTLFEVSWEVCHKVGGIHTVVSTKARALAERLGDAYVVVGPWLLGGTDAASAFAAESGNEAFEEVCSGRLDVTPMVGRIVGLDDVPTALDDARDANGPARIIVVPGR